MPRPGQMTGMLGVYLTAAELTNQGLIVSVTSRNARGADLLATNQSYKNTWSIQVKTNRRASRYWLLNKHYKTEVAKRHVYVFVNLRGDKRPDYYVVPSHLVRRCGRVFHRPRSVWYAFFREDAGRYQEKWSVFNDRK